VGNGFTFHYIVVTFLTHLLKLTKIYISATRLLANRLISLVPISLKLWGELLASLCRFGELVIMPDAIKSQQRDYLGTGWSFPMCLSLQGGIQLSSEAQKVKESIWIILRTGVGERVYRPNFGSRLAELAFAPMNSETLILIRLYVLEALEVWETRIIIDEVITEPYPVGGRVDIIINYRLKDQPDIYSFVYPYYLALVSD
jgi:uncharacterized protein